MIGGVLCGLGGAYLSIAQSAGFMPNMTAGKGFIALAALIFAKWRAWPALGACLLFGLLDAVAIRLQGVSLPGIGRGAGAGRSRRCPISDRDPARRLHRHARSRRAPPASLM